MSCGLFLVSVGLAWQFPVFPGLERVLSVTFMYYTDVLAVRSSPRAVKLLVRKLYLGSGQMKGLTQIMNHLFIRFTLVI